MAIPFGFAAVAPGAGARGLRSGVADRRCLLARAGCTWPSRARAAPGSAAALGIVVFFAGAAARAPAAGAGCCCPVGAVVLAAALSCRALAARATRTTRSATSPGRAWCSTRSIRRHRWRARASGCGGARWRCTATHPLSGVGPGNFARPVPAARRAERGRGRRHVGDDGSAPAAQRAARAPRRDGPAGPGGVRGAVRRRVRGRRWRSARAARARGAADDAVGDLDAASAAAGAVAACLGCGLTAFPLAMPGDRAAVRRVAGRARRARARAGRRGGPAAAPAARSARLSARWPRAVAVVLVAGRGLAVVRRACVVVLAGPGAGGAGGAAATRAPNAVAALAPAGTRRARAAARPGPLRHRAAGGAGRACGSGAADRRCRRRTARSRSSRTRRTRGRRAPPRELALRDEAQAARRRAARDDAVPRPSVRAHDAGDRPQAGGCMPSRRAAAAPTSTSQRRQRGESVTMPEPRVAIVHDWLVSMRGGERVLESLCRLYPRADVYTLALRQPEPVAARSRRTG